MKRLRWWRNSHDLREDLEPSNGDGDDGVSVEELVTVSGKPNLRWRISFFIPEMDSFNIDPWLDSWVYYGLLDS